MLFFCIKKRELTFVKKKNVGSLFAFLWFLLNVAKKITSAIPTGNTCLKKSNIAFLIFGNAKKQFCKKYVVE